MRISDTPVCPKSKQEQQRKRNGEEEEEEDKDEDDELFERFKCTNSCCCLTCRILSFQKKKREKNLFDQRLKSY